MGRSASNAVSDEFLRACGRGDGTVVRRLWLCCASVLIVLFCFAVQASAMSAREFYRYAKKYKCQIPFAATVQSAHETADWTSELWVKAHNGAGIKADKAWRAARKPVYNKSSAEHVGGRTVNRVSAFRKYPSTKAFLRDYAKKIREDYPHSAKQKDNVWLYFAGLYRGRRGKWATDRRYYEKLVAKTVKIAPQIYGSKWRTKLRAQFKRAQKRLEPWQAQAVRKAIG